MTDPSIVKDYTIDSPRTRLIRIISEYEESKELLRSKIEEANAEFRRVTLLIRALENSILQSNAVNNKKKDELNDKTLDAVIITCSVLIACIFIAQSTYSMC